MHTVRPLGVLAAVVALLATAGCAAADVSDDRTNDPPAAAEATAETTDESTAESTEPEATEPEATDQPAPAADVPEELRFTSQTLDGAPFEGESLAGQKAVLWFWAPWCPNCRREAPGVGRVAENTAGEVTFVGVAAQDEVPAMQEFVSDHGLGSFDHLADVDAEVWQRFGVTYQPAYAFIGADGSVEVVKGGLEEGELADRAAAL